MTSVRPVRRKVPPPAPIARPRAADRPNRDVGKIGEDQVKAGRTCRERTEPELHPSDEPEPARVGHRHLDRPVGDIEAVTRLAGSSSATASATAPEPVPISSTDPGLHFKRQLNQHLGLRPGHEDPTVNISSMCRNPLLPRM